MAREQEVLRNVESAPTETLVGANSLASLHQAAASMREARQGRNRFKTKDLVGLLLAHGARSWRASSARVHMRLRVEAPNGATAVKIRF